MKIELNKKEVEFLLFKFKTEVFIQESLNTNPSPISTNIMKGIINKLK